MTMRITRLFTDGGVIGSNPSAIGGTVAFCMQFSGAGQLKYARAFSAKQLKVDEVTNNQTELYAVILGLGYLFEEEIACIYSDSEITLGRLFKGYAMKNIPEFMVNKLSKERKRLINWHRFQSILLKGHPTWMELNNGISKTGRPVHSLNKWCDEQCSKKAHEYLQRRK